MSSRPEFIKLCKEELAKSWADIIELDDKDVSFVSDPLRTMIKECVNKKATQDSRFCTAVESGIRRGVDFEYRRSKHHEHIVTRDGAKWKCIECGELFESTRGPVQGI